MGSRHPCELLRSRSLRSGREVPTSFPIDAVKILIRLQFPERERELAGNILIRKEMRKIFRAKELAARIALCS
jgi:hypothetical protein